MYRQFVLPFHKTLIASCKRQGWEMIGMHICGNITPIFLNIMSTDVDLIDVDYQVDTQQAISLADGRVCLRGNLDPSSCFRFGSQDEVIETTKELLQTVSTCHKWILSSGCDIPPGTPSENIHAFMHSTN
jgi:uroporphyrinogen decarboxylase